MFGNGNMKRPKSEMAPALREFIFTTVHFAQYFANVQRTLIHRTSSVPDSNFTRS